MTYPDLLGRTRAAVRAATGAGVELGLAVQDPRVLYDVFSVVVHLFPSPVVVRVPTVLPRTVAADPAAQMAQQALELNVAGWLAEQGYPVVPPSSLVPREPVGRDGFSMTFWQFVDEIHVDAADSTRRIELVAQLHAGLRHYPEELPFLMPLDASVPDGLEQLKRLPELLDPAYLNRAIREWAVIAPLVSSRPAFQAAFPAASVQAIHGDAPEHNFIRTADGDLCGDFEHVTSGPVEWDLAFTDPHKRAVYDASAQVVGLRPLDGQVLAVMECARMLQLLACLPLAPALPGLAAGLKPAIDSWRASVEVGELLQ